MVFEIILLCLVISIAYGSAVFGIFAIIRRMGISSSTAVFLSFLIFGSVTGFLLLMTWPSEGAIYIGIPPVIIGDEIYSSSTRYFGDPSSAQAYYTIPWVLRIPQVYFFSSIGFWGVTGLIVQLVYNRKVRVIKLKI